MRPAASARCQQQPAHGGCELPWQLRHWKLASSGTASHLCSTRVRSVVYPWGLEAGLGCQVASLICQGTTPGGSLHCFAASGKVASSLLRQADSKAHG